MKPIGIVAPDEQGIRDALAAELAGRGRVGVVERSDPGTRGPPAGADTVYRLDADGWAAAGGGTGPRAALEALAPDHDYAILTGYPDADVRHVVVWDVEYDGEPLVSVPDPDEFDPAGIVDALDGVEPFETLESLVARAKRSPDADRAGAIATFTGRVRERDAPDDAPTTRLEFEKYAGVAEERMDALSDELSGRDGVHEVLMHHRVGAIESGEDIVFVVVLAGHREEAFRTVRDGIDRLKEEVPIFKKEITAEESFWVHERS